MSKSKNNSLPDSMMEDLGSFMTKYGIEEIQFGKKHSLVKDETGKAIPKKPENELRKLQRNSSGKI